MKISIKKFLRYKTPINPIPIAVEYLIDLPQPHNITSYDIKFT